jgi:hypothetical protein
MSARPLRIAMWSGPRNISTAMMRAWENHPDCAVSDEPLYAHYLSATGADHPGRDEVIASGECDWRKVVAQLLGPAPGDMPIWYQKHMCHHLLPQMDLAWIEQLHNVLLIRDPTDVVASYLRTRDRVSATDIGLPQQAQLFTRLRQQLGAPPPVLDAGDFLANPEAYLRLLCEKLGIVFSARMLHWPVGPRASDGVWAKYWYHAVWQSTGFEVPPARAQRPDLSSAAEQVVTECKEIYQMLHSHRIVI